ncbi:hypothetical protein ACHAP5_004643 [Fusarium lateritium]
MANLPPILPIGNEISPDLMLAYMMDETNRLIDALRTPARKNIQRSDAARRQEATNTSLLIRKRPRNESPSQACDSTSDNVAISKKVFDDMANRVRQLEDADAARKIASERLMERLESLEVENLALKQKVARLEDKSG